MSDESNCICTGSDLAGLGHRAECPYPAARADGATERPGTSAPGVNLPDIPVANATAYAVEVLDYYIAVSERRQPPGDARDVRALVSEWRERRHGLAEEHKPHPGCTRYHPCRRCLTEMVIGLALEVQKAVRDA